MTDDEILSAYMEAERAANRKPAGADVVAIIILLSVISGRPIDDVRRIVRDGTVMGAV